MRITERWKQARTPELFDHEWIVAIKKNGKRRVIWPIAVWRFFNG